MSKSYKLKREVVEEFARACEEEGVSQASQLTKMMKEFVEKRKIVRISWLFFLIKTLYALTVRSSTQDKTPSSHHNIA